MGTGERGKKYLGLSLLQPSDFPAHLEAWGHGNKFQGSASPEPEQGREGQRMVVLTVVGGELTNENDQHVLANLCYFLKGSQRF